MFFSLEAAKPTCTRSAEDLLKEKNNCVPLLSAGVTTEEGASSGKIRQAPSALQQAGKGYNGGTCLTLQPKIGP